MHRDRRNLVLLGPVDSGKSALIKLIAGGGSRRNDRSRVVDINLAPDEPGIRARLFEPAAVDRNRVCLDIVREQTTDTCFVVVVVDITKSVDFTNELVSLKELSELLSDLSYSLFGNCMIAFTHIDDLPAEVNTDRLVQQEFQEILSLVENRCMFLNTTDRSQESRGRALEQFIRLTKLTLKILCYGNNVFKSEAFLPGLFGEISDNVYLYRAPDLNLFNPSQHRTTPELSNLLGDQENIGKGVSAFVILIGYSEVFSRAMLDLIKSIPTSLGLDAESAEYFWNRAIIVFNTEGHDNPEGIIRDSIIGNIGIKEIVNIAGGRYTYVSENLSSNENQTKLEEHCRNIKITNNNREFIGGRNVMERALRETTETNLPAPLARVPKFTLLYRVASFLTSLARILSVGPYKLAIFSVVIGLGASIYAVYNLYSNLKGFTF